MQARAHRKGGHVVVSMAAEGWCSVTQAWSAPWPTPQNYPDHEAENRLQVFTLRAKR